MLTGESIPVMKSSLPFVSTEKYSLKGSEKYTLFGGTSVIQKRPVGDEPVLGLVINTGFLTTKGSLIRDILYPKKIKLKFYEDSIKFVGIMALIAVASIIATVPSNMKMGQSLKDAILSCLNLITTAIPAALPVSMSVGIVFGTNRLKKKNIFCISPPRINMAG